MCKSISVLYLVTVVYVFLWASRVGSVVNNMPANAGDAGSIPGSGRSPAEGSDNLLQYSWLGSAMDRGAWHTNVHGVEKDLDMT